MTRKGGMKGQEVYSRFMGKGLRRERASPEMAAPFVWLEHSFPGGLLGGV